MEGNSENQLTVSCLIGHRNVKPASFDCLPLSNTMLTASYLVSQRQCTDSYLVSALRCRWIRRYQRTLCLGTKSDIAIVRSCHPWTKTWGVGFSFESERSIMELVGEVGLESHWNHEWLPQSRKFCPTVTDFIYECTYVCMFYISKCVWKQELCAMYCWQQWQTLWPETKWIGKCTGVHWMTKRHIQCQIHQKLIIMLSLGVSE